MSRSPLAYPLTRGIDADAGGAADLQTDIMRFMAILALCLMAIFALVQSLPLAPAPQIVEQPAPEVPAEPIDEPTVAEAPVVQAPAEPAPAAEPAPEPEEQVVLTRPRWVSTFQPRTESELTRPEPTPQPVAQTVTEAAPPAPAPEPVAPAPEVPEREGFTLRFESDIALTRLVASGQVGFYAIDAGRARRMSVSESRISFWDASTPGSFHEMEASTVPRSVVDALARAGADASGVDWGVTLPGRLSTQLQTLMRENSGGALVIRSSGILELEDS